MQRTENAVHAINPAHLHPATEMGSVTLKVADLARSLEFYTGLVGLAVIEQDQQIAVLGTGQSPLVILNEVPGAIKQPEFSTGLYHAAILLPTRRDLAVKVRQIARARYPMGYADHLVSEAFYISDPDGNGLEIYRDRPRSEWSFDGKSVRMASDPIDFDSLFAEIPADEPDSSQMPVGTKLGHMHLRIGNVKEAEAFYHGLLGFDVMVRWPGALFVSAGGYHHHLGLNTWHSLGAGSAPEKSVGLRRFSILLPDEAEQERVAAHLSENGITVHRRDGVVLLSDPWQNEIQLGVRSDRV